MDDDEKRWIRNAIECSKDATGANTLFLIVRKQDANDQADIVITNAQTPEMVAALFGYLEDESDG